MTMMHIYNTFWKCSNKTNLNKIYNKVTFWYEFTEPFIGLVYLSIMPSCTQPNLIEFLISLSSCIQLNQVLVSAFVFVLVEWGSKQRNLKMVLFSTRSTKVIRLHRNTLCQNRTITVHIKYML